MANGLESLTQSMSSSSPPNKEEDGYLDKTMDVAGEVWGGLSGLDKAALLTSPVPIVGDIVGGVADAKALYDDPSLVNLAMMAAGLIPFVPSGGVTRTAQKAFTNLRNDIPGFYDTNNPVKQGLAWAKTLPEGAGNIVKARYSPESRAIQEEFNISVADQKAARKALAVNKKETANIEKLKEKLKKDKDAGKNIKKIETDIKDATTRAKTEAKKAMGQLNQSRSMDNQYFGPEGGSGGFLKNIDEIDHVKTFSNLNVDDYYKTVGEVAGLPKEDISGIFKQIEKVQKVNPNKNYLMNIRRAYTQSAGNLDPGIKSKVLGGKSFEDLQVELFPTSFNSKSNKIIYPKPYKNNKDFLEALQKIKIGVLNPEEVLKGRSAIVTGSGKSDAFELGGVNYMSSISKDGKVVTIVSDEHDLFGTPAGLQKVIKTDSVGKLPGADRYMNVSEPMVKELVQSKQAATTTKQASKKLSLADQKKSAVNQALKEYEKIPGVDISGTKPVGFRTNEQWARTQAVANLKPTSKDYSRLYKETGISIPVRASKPLLREEEEETIPQRKRGGSVVERNPYNYTAKAI